MQARGPLMIEHRLIEKMIEIIKESLEQISSTGKADISFIDTAVDFIRIYADRTHHGKEEDILFNHLNEKDLSDNDKKIMNELIEEHMLGRRTTKALADANDRYREGDSTSLSGIVENLEALIDFYPKHIEKEDKVFFPASRKYFTDEEDQAMLREFWEFDRQMIHEKYESVVKHLLK